MEADTESNALKPMKMRFIKMSLLLAGLAVFSGLFGSSSQDRATRFHHTDTGRVRYW